MAEPSLWLPTFWATTTFSAAIAAAWSKACQTTTRPDSSQDSNTPPAAWAAVQPTRSTKSRHRLTTTVGEGSAAVGNSVSAPAVEEGDCENDRNRGPDDVGIREVHGAPPGCGMVRALAEK